MKFGKECFVGLIAFAILAPMGYMYITSNSTIQQGSLPIKIGLSFMRLLETGENPAENSSTDINQTLSGTKTRTTKAITKIQTAGVQEPRNSTNLTIAVNVTLRGPSTPTEKLVIPVTTPSPNESSILNVDCHGCLAGKKLVTVQKGWICGAPRLGNKMSMLAPAIAYASRYNATLVLIKGDNDQCQWPGMLRDLFLIFNKTAPILPDSMTKGWDNVGESGFTDFVPLKYTEKNFTIAGYRQSWKFFSSEVEQKAVREAFTFTPHYELSAHKMIEMVKRQFYNITTNPIFVGVHMRIGDLMQDDRIKYGYQMANSSFYDNAMTVATMLLAGHSANQLNSTQLRSNKSIIFLVASDSHNEAKQILQKIPTKYNIFWLTGSAFEDFAVLSKCSHSIISGGTYGFWTAWLAGGKTIYFANYAKPNSSFSQGFKSKNFYLPSWNPVR